MPQPFPRSSFRLWLLGHAVVFPAVALAAEDPTAAPAPSETAVPDIIVTSSRRAERMLKVPYDITAVTGEDIESQHIIQPNDLLREIPGVTVIDRGPRNGGQVDSTRVRGIGVDYPPQGDLSLETVSPVSNYINDTPLFANLLLKDINRVEFLRGPQATLYGSGSLGGTIKYIQNEPSTEAFSGVLTSTQSYTANSDGAAWNGDLTLNIPITDTFAMRGTISRLQDPGFIDYTDLYNLRANDFPPLLAGAKPLPSQFHRDNSANDTRTWYGRFAAAWTPDPDLKVVFNYNKQDDRTGGRQAYSEGSDGFGNGYGRYGNGSAIAEPSARDVSVESLEASYDLGFATLTSSSSYYDHRGESQTDNTGFTGRVYAFPPFTPVGYLYYSTYFAPKLVPYVRALNSFSDRSWVEELRLASNASPDAPVDYVVGFYFQDQNRGALQTDEFPGLVETYEQNPFLGPSFLYSDQNFIYQRSEHYQDRAGFGEVTWHVTPRLSVTGGLRYFSNEQTVVAYIGGAVLTRFLTPQLRTTDVAETRPLGKGSLSYQLDDDNLLYATFSQGYRRGGSNAVPITGPQRESQYYLNYKSDNTNNYEIGAKGTTGRLNYEAALYWIDWSHPQLNTVTPGFGYFAVVNGQAAVSRGVELQLAGRITPEVGFRVGYAYTNAFVSKEFVAPPAYYSQYNYVLAREGTPLPAVPDHEVSVSVDHTLPLTDEMALTSRVTGTYQSAGRNSLSGGYQDVGIDAYMLWNASTTVTWKQYQASLFVRNLFNAKGVQSIYTTAYSGGNTAANFYGSDSIGTPLTVGLTLSYRF